VRPTLDRACFKSLGEEDNLFLDAPFTEEEIRMAVWDCTTNKSPGLYGINLKFVNEF